MLRERIQTVLGNAILSEFKIITGIACIMDWEFE
jgi:hypothetical protein